MSIILILEISLLIAVILAAKFCRLTSGRRVNRLVYQIRRTTRNRPAWIATIGACTFLTVAGVGVLVHWPAPSQHDEFAYLLSGDTFAKGRLTNPTHPHWEHFESYNIFHRPTYQSKFPPGQGLTLALGQVVANEAIVGVWITLAVAVAAITWMAYGWLPPPWAVVCGSLVALNYRILRFWGHSFMGGGLALLGGALFFGALPRAIRRPRFSTGIIAGVGIVTLAFSRPYEGLFCVAAGIVYFAFRALKAEESQTICWKDQLRSTLLPSATVLFVGFLWLGVFHTQVTGQPWKMPYQVWLETYNHEPSLSSVILRSDMQTAPQSIGASRLLGQRTERDWNVWLSERSNISKKLVRHWMFLIGVVLTPVIPFALWSSRQTRMRFAILAAVGCLSLILAQNTHGHPHYAAPVAGLVAIVTTQGLRGLKLTFLGRQAGRELSRLLVITSFLSTALYLGLQWVPHPVPRSMAWSIERERLTRLFRQHSQRHLVFVRYPPASTSGIRWNQWVYNEADIDQSAVVWAHDLGSHQNHELKGYFGDRQAWLLDLDAMQLRRFTKSDRTIDSNVVESNKSAFSLSEDAFVPDLHSAPTSLVERSEQ